MRPYISIYTYTCESTDVVGVIDMHTIGSQVGTINEAIEALLAQAVENAVPVRDSGATLEHREAMLGLASGLLLV